ncbi:MAG: 3-isopropylmalate dehydratase [Conexivisphaerales archaeon]
MKGKVFLVGDNIDTDVIAPGGYLNSIQQLKEHCMEGVYPGLSKKVEHGDVLIVGKNFKCGSSREQTVIILKELGFGLILAKSFARIFFRNAVNQALPLGIADVASVVKDGELIEYSINNRTLSLRDGRIITFAGLQGPLKEIFQAEGLINFVKKKLALQT